MTSTSRRTTTTTARKSILGQNGRWTARTSSAIILGSPERAAYIARRLYHYFVADVPPDERGGDKNLTAPQRAVLRELADMLYNRQYELRPVLRRLLLSRHFYDDAFINQQIKSPAVLAVGAVRSLGTPVRDLSILNDALDLMGQRIFFPPSVKGWEGGRAWINTSTFFVRQNLLAFLLTGKKPQGYDATADTQRYDPLPLLDERRGEADAESRRRAPRVARLPAAALHRSGAERDAAVEAVLKPRGQGRQHGSARP